MSDAPPSAAAHAFDCPLCGGAFEIDAEWLGKTIPCPHCGGGVLLPVGPPAASSAAPAPGAKEPPAAPATSTAPEPPPRKRTAAERAALRRRVNVTLALVGALLLIGLFFVLAESG